MTFRKTLITLATTTTTALALSFGSATATAQDDTEAVNESMQTSAVGSIDAMESALRDPVLQGPAMGSAVVGVMGWFLWCLASNTSSAPEDRCYF